MFVFALAFALYALVEPYLGRAGAAATLAGVIGILIAMVAIALMPRKPRPKPRSAAASGPETLVARVTAFVQEKPVVAVAAAAAAGFLAIRNPRYLGEMLRSFVGDGNPPRG